MRLRNRYPALPKCRLLHPRGSSSRGPVQAELNLLASVWGLDRPCQPLFVCNFNIFQLFGKRIVGKLASGAVEAIAEIAQAGHDVLALVEVTVQGSRVNRDIGVISG
jgi:hypothetical protein